MCKYNREENRLLGLPLNTECSLERMYSNIYAEKMMEELLQLDIEEATRRIRDYYNEDMPETPEERYNLKQKIKEKYMKKLRQPPCRKETMEACKAAEETLKD